MAKLLISLALGFLCAALGPLRLTAEAQVYQQGSVIPQHYMMWAGGNAAQDAGGVARLPQGLQPFEMGIVAPPNATGNAFPSTAAGSGPNGENSCIYDSPLGQAGHYLCFSPNLGSNLAAITVGALSGGTVGGLEFIINGTKIPFPGAGTGTVVGPGSSVAGDVTCWNNTLGTIVADCGPSGTVVPLAPTQATSDNSTKVATTAYVKAQGYITSSTIVVGPQGRLTLSTGQPVMTATVANVANIYYTAYNGNIVPVWNGSSSTLLPIPSNQLTLVLTSLEEASGFVFDVFAVNNGGTLALCTPTNGGGSSGEGWAADTGGSNNVRGTGFSQLAFTTAGYVTNANSITNCFGGVSGTTNLGPISANQATYLGTYYTTAAGQTSMTFAQSASGGVAGCMCLWNYYNQVPYAGISTDSGTTYTYTSSTVREARASTGNQVSIVTGLTVTYPVDVFTGTTAAAAGATTITSASTASNSQGAVISFVNTAAANIRQAGTTVRSVLTLGFVTFFRVEASDGTNANVFDSVGLDNITINANM